jgi:hypothetical protein
MVKVGFFFWGVSGFWLLLILKGKPQYSQHQVVKGLTECGSAGALAGQGHQINFLCLGLVSVCLGQPLVIEVVVVTADDSHLAIAAACLGDHADLVDVANSNLVSTAKLACLSK